MGHDYDILIIGAGPGGCAAALAALREGLKVAIFEKAHHPRFHIGETLLPRLMGVIDDLGLRDELAKLPQVLKIGAEFNMGNDPTPMNFYFRDGLLGGQPVFNIERAHFDKMLCDQARARGATIFEDTTVKSVVRLAEGDVAISTGDRTFTGRVLLDASGHGTVLGRHLNQRRNFDEPELQKVAYFSHFENVATSTPDRFPCIVMCEEGWFWLIPISDTKMSVGFVTRPNFVKTLSVKPTEILYWAIQRCPVVRDRMRNATGPTTNMVLSNFSYTCKPFAGPGWYMVGDAGCFLDPIFSTGVTLALVGGVEAARLSAATLRGEIAPEKARKTYCDLVRDSTGIFWRIIKNYYRHPFRELFLNGGGPLQVHRAIFSVLAGHVFPKPVWALRWRLRFFWMCMAVQRWVPVVRFRPPCRLLEERAVEMPNLTVEAHGPAFAVA